MRKKIAIFSTLFILVMSVVMSVGAREVIYYESSDYDGVLTVQRKLKNWGYYDGVVDGEFGYRTEQAVKAFQEKNGLDVTGKVNDETFVALGMSIEGYPGTDSADVNLLARCIHGEARGEPYSGKVAVAAVILNRVENASFPNSISGVIYQSGAFDAVSDGQINLTPDDESIRAANDAMAGWDPTGGAIYYYNPKTATNEWIRSREIITTIGDHVFCY